MLLLNQEAVFLIMWWGGPSSRLVMMLILLAEFGMSVREGESDAAHAFPVAFYRKHRSGSPGVCCAVRAQSASHARSTGSHCARRCAEGEGAAPGGDWT